MTRATSAEVASFGFAGSRLGVGIVTADSPAAPMPQLQIHLARPSISPQPVARSCILSIASAAASPGDEVLPRAGLPYAGPGFFLHAKRLTWRRLERATRQHVNAAALGGALLSSPERPAVNVP